MALRQLIITQRMAALRQERENLVAAMEELRNRRTAWEERESRAEAAFRELNENSTEEERAAFDTEAGEIEAERVALEADETANSTRTGEIDNELGELETELEKLNERSKPKKKPVSAPVNHNERGVHTMNEFETRVHQMVQNSEEVRTFLGNLRAARAGNSGSISGVELTIPAVMLPTIREATDRNSVLVKHVNRQRVAGEGSMSILGAVPEAIWTETVGKINEVMFSINQVRVGGSKLGAFISVPNPWLEDSDENLAAIVIDYLGQANGYALDKAILYGTGANMPVGIMTRLAAASQPTWWQNTAPEFTNLSATNVGKASGAGIEGVDLFKEIFAVLGKPKAKYTGGTGSKFWAMNESTYAALQSALMSINASGAVVTGAARTMPVIGGAVEFLDFIPDGDIIGGVGGQYVLAERAGLQISRSEHVKFLDDHTVFKSTSRWDGRPVAGEGFAAFNINGAAVTTSVEFAEDIANKA